MNDFARPSPAALLRAAKREARGRLKIFLGAAPGVGKTFEMLREGGEALKAETDIVVGIVETHGRAETEALVAPFEVLPRREVEHGGHVLPEFDLDAMLRRAPEIALVDEFAHTNAPGSRHPKRWQDIEELRDAGIHVLTTLNVQHVESLNDVVASFTHVRVRETVPDAILDDADIEIVDLPPDELIARLRAGKVYVPEEATRALGNFFSKSNLSALRELALRQTAKTVDRDLLDHVDTTGETGTWAAGERIVVAVGDQPGGEALIRSAKRLADALHAPWTAVVVETPRTETLGADARTRIAGALNLATSLGATIATVPARAVFEGLCAHVHETRATAVVVGKSRRSWWFELRHGSVVDRLVRSLNGVAVYVMPVADTPANHDGQGTARPSPLRGMMAGVAFVALTTALAVGLSRLIEVNSVSLLYLLPVIAAATLFGLRASLATTVAAALAYNFFFLPPLYTFTIADPQNVVTLLVLTVVAVVASQLAGRLRREANIGVRTAGENAALAAFGQRLASVSDEAGTAMATCEEITAVIGTATVLLVERDGRRIVAGGYPELATLSAIDTTAADWSFDRREVAGRDTGTLTASEWQFHPLVTSLGVLAVLGVLRDTPGSPIPADRQVLFATMLGLAALAHERLKLEAQAREVGALQQRDNLRATLISSIGHDLRTPLTAVVAAADALAVEHGASPTTNTLRGEARRLRRVFDDLVEMTRIEAGKLVVKREATDLTDAVASAIDDLKAELVGHRLAVEVAATLPLVEADPRMLHHILINLLGNAAKFAPAGTTITVRAQPLKDWLTLAVLDEGPGLPHGAELTLFDRFTRVDGDDRTGGTGLGLAIVKGFADAMGLEIVARNRPSGGASFALSWDEARLRRQQP